MELSENEIDDLNGELDVVNARISRLENNKEETNNIM